MSLGVTNIDALVVERDALAAKLTAALQARNDECRLRQGAERRYTEIAAELAATRKLLPFSAWELGERAKALETALRRWETSCTGKHGSQMPCCVPLTLSAAVGTCCEKCGKLFEGPGTYGLCSLCWASTMETDSKHAFTGDGGEPCTKCGKPYRDAIHDFTSDRGEK